jgi:arylsulfatase A-like enzyme
MGPESEIIRKMKMTKQVAVSLLAPALIMPSSLNLNNNFQIPEKRPVNVLFLLADDLRANTVNYLGNREIITPNLDNLSKNGISFTHAYIMGGSQGAVSVPSRAMIMTGKYLATLEKTGTVIPKNHLMIGEYMQNKGYEMHGIGKWHNGTGSYARSFSSGGHIFFGGMTDQFNPLLWTFDKEGKYIQDSSKEQPHLYKNKNVTELFSDDAVRYLNEANGKKPFFLYVAFTSPHDPRSMPKEYLEMYDTSRIALPINFLPHHPFNNGELKVRDELLAGFPRSKSEIKLHIRDYYAMITHLDAQIGRILEALRNNGQYDNTIIIFAGDNGLALGQHGLMGKQSVYEHSIGVPLIFSGPGIPADKKSQAFCYLIDIYPTICEKLGFDIPSTVDGKSLTACFINEKTEIRKYLYFSYRDFQRAFRDKEFKLIEYNVEGKRTTQLFDLHADPYENNDLSQKKEYAGKINDLRKKMLNERSIVRDNGSFWNGVDFSRDTK